MRDLLAAARGDAPADLVIKGGVVANVLSLEYETADVAIKDGVIVGVGSGYEGAAVEDASGLVLMPGMIDGHMHVESTMLTPSAFAAAVMPLGTTTVMPDPHEIANTCGMDGVRFMAGDARRVPLDFHFGAPSCVPASSFETPRADFGPDLVKRCFDDGLCDHLGEMMNFPGIINGLDEPWSKIGVSAGRVRTGHCPGTSGRELCAYMLSGCDSDHECDSADDALERLRRGMWLMLREGATERDLRKLSRVIRDDEARHSRCMAVSDDLNAAALLREGHMDHKVRVLIEEGIRPLVAAALVTINPARYFRLWDRGAIAPGMIADIAVVDSLESCRAQKVWKRGALVAEGGKALFRAGAPAAGGLPKAPTLGAAVSQELFRVPAEPGRRIRVIRAIPHSLVTENFAAEPRIEGGFAVSDPGRDIIKLSVVEKNRGTGRTASGFLSGSGLKSGAIASSVAHDAHNYIILGADDESMATALSAIAESGGGLAAARGGQVLALLPLPIGGLMSDMDARGVADAAERLHKACGELGVTADEPFMTLSFLSLSVIPSLKLTDQGYVNLAEGGIVPLFVD